MNGQNHLWNAIWLIHFLSGLYLPGPYLSGCCSCASARGLPTMAIWYSWYSKVFISSTNLDQDLQKKTHKINIRFWMNTTKQLYHNSFSRLRKQLSFCQLPVRKNGWFFFFRLIVDQKKTALKILIFSSNNHSSLFHFYLFLSLSHSFIHFSINLIRLPSPNSLVHLFIIILLTLLSIYFILFI